MSKKNTLEAKALRRAERGEYKGGYADLRNYWTTIRSILSEEQLENNELPQTKLVSLDKALRLSKGYMTLGNQIFKLNPKWEIV